MGEESFFKRKTIPPLAQDSFEKEENIPLPNAIGPYKVDNLLEKGGMSLLYLATHPDIQAPITIKILLPKFLSHPEMTARFLKEAEIIALADHPNIVKLYGYGQWEGGLYIAMEFIRGRSLRKYLAQNPLSLKTALEMVLEIAYALCHLHTHGVIHRDLKPENILIDEKGHVKVIDFGVAQLIDPLELAKDEDPSKKQRLMGTPVYMSPEQRENPENVSYPSDIFSLGIIAYELVLGKLQGGQVHLSLMPKGLEKILAKALQPKVQERYIDIVDFISDLSSYLHSPQFEKEKKTKGQAGELFEKLQLIQYQLLPNLSFETPQCKIGLTIHRPLGFSGIFAEYSEKNNRLMLGESSHLEIDSLLHILYIKGVLDGLASGNHPPETFVKNLNAALMTAPNNHPFSFCLIQFSKEKPVIEYLSCGYGSLWKISKKEIFQIEPTNLALGMTPDFLPKQEIIAYSPGDQFIFCPLSETGHPFTAEQFKQLLSEEKENSPQGLTESILWKARSLYPKYFDEHPFIIAAIKFP